MATKKKAPQKKAAGKKNSAVKKRKGKARKKAKKGKVKLDAKKVLTLAAAIVTICLLVLIGIGLVKPSLQNMLAKKTDAPSVELSPSDAALEDNSEKEAQKTDESNTSPKKTEQSTPSPAVDAKPKAKDEESTPPKVDSPSKSEEKTPSAPVPKKDEVIPSTPKPLFEIPKAKNGASLVFVIDDAGLSVNNVKKYTELPFPITIAVLPKLSHSKDCAWVVRSSGKELILHQPMQSVNLNINPGEGAIKPDMQGSQISELIKENVSEIGPGVKGFNNHEGSLITEDLNKMTFVLGTAKEEGLYFLDSRTSSNSQAPQAALEHDMKILERNAPFLDNTVTREAMLSELYRGLEVANRDGYAIMIGHVDKSAEILPKLLSDIYPYLVEAGYRILTPSALLQN